ncbi:MAG: CHAT domain-containing protein [Coleofasciculus sp. Co-bin14]|nr:CHAT domain-containing protein [Coleofasciculus sp. Co-bin14]
MSSNQASTPEFLAPVSTAPDLPAPERLEAEESATAMSVASPPGTSNRPEGNLDQDTPNSGATETPEPTPTSSPQAPTETPTEEPETRMLIAEVVIQGAEGELQDKALQVIKTRSGLATTRSQLQEDVNAIFGTGFFSSVNVNPEDTPLGVRVTFIVQPNPVLRQVTFSLVPRTEGKGVLPQQVVDKIFQDQYGKVVNHRELQAGIAKIQQWYKENGYDLANVIDTSQASKDGTVNLIIAEGVIEDMTVQFLNAEGEATDKEGKPIQGITPVSKILAEVELKPEDIFNRTRMQASLQRIFNLGIAEDVQAAFKPGQDPRQVVVVINILNEQTALESAAKPALDAVAEKKYSEAVNHYQRVLQIARQTQSKEEEALTLNNLANVYKQLQDYQQAVNAYNQALPIFRELNATLPEIFTLVNAAEAYRKLGKPAQALALYQQAFPKVRAIEQNFKLTDLFGNSIKLRGEQFGDLSDDEDRQLISGFRYLFELGLFLDMVTTYGTLGDYQQAIYLANNSQVLTASSTLENLTRDVLKNQLNSKGLERYEDKIAQTLSKFPEIARLLILGSVYLDLDNNSRLQAYSKQIRELAFNDLDSWKLVLDKETSNEITPYLRLGENIFSVLFDDRLNQQKKKELLQQVNLNLESVIDKKQIEQIAPYIRAFLPIFLSFFKNPDDNQIMLDLINEMLPLWQSFGEVSKEVSWVKPFLLNWQGDTYFRLGRNQQALESYHQALQLWLSINNTSFTVGQDFMKADTLTSLGKVYTALGKPQDALNFYHQALPIWLRLKSVIQETETRYGIAKVKWELGNFSEAQSQIETAIEKLENNPPKITNLVSGSGFLSAEYDYNYGFKQNNLKFGLGLSSNPLGITSKASTLTSEQTCANPAGYFACKQKYFDLYINLLMQLHQQQPYRGYDVLAFEASERARSRNLQVFQTNRDVLGEGLNGGQMLTDANGSRKGGLQIDRPARLVEIQRQVLDNNTLLLEYFLGEKNSYLWVVSANAPIQTYLLPGRSEIEDVAREFYDILTRPSGRIRPMTTATVGKKLSEMLLSPVAAQLAQKRLLVVGDGILQYIPFSALPDPAPDTRPSSTFLKGEFASYMQPLLVKHEIINLPSASTLVSIRKNRSHRSSPSKELAILAAPVFNYEDKRLAQQLTKTGQTTNGTGEVFRNTTLSEVETLYAPLPGTEQEVERIFEFIPPDKRAKFLGFEANHQIALSSELNRYRIIHFATHGIFNSKSPQRSGVILSAINEKGELQRGLLSPSDAINMQLSAADLVVLSGCRTGLGEEVRRESLVGLTEGLMSAGAERVVVSLWSVQDDATAELMARFYEGMYKKKLPPAQALREAQRSMWEEPRWQTPYYWAAFTIQGEWK